MAQVIVEGQSLISECVFRLAGVATDPAVVKCFVRDPDGGITEFTYPDTSLVRTDLGTYECSVATDAPGTWAFRWSGTGGIEALDEVAIDVAKSLVLG